MGFLSDSILQAFLIPQDKRIKFATLRDSILQCRTVSIKALQRFAGKLRIPVSVGWHSLQSLRTTFGDSRYLERRRQRQTYCSKESPRTRQHFKSWKSVLSNCRVDAHVDCLALIQAWERQGGKSTQLNDALKLFSPRIFLSVCSSCPLLSTRLMLPLAFCLIRIACLPPSRGRS
ncbi:unnamed protein product [Porites lobata]|uniref:Uncharacterized protein n=1 Tax=Porites lobata TaxID=104759 RepID=A0ABN8S8N7_9CNID|nr:unnamed protein product [Porites lobata]